MAKCECEQAGRECGVRVYVGTPGSGTWMCQTEALKRANIDVYYREKSQRGQPPPMPR